MIKEDGFIIFRNHGHKGFWEVSSKSYTTYVGHDIINNEDTFGITLMLALHGMSPGQMDHVVETLIRYTKDPQEDMFLISLGD